MNRKITIAAQKLPPKNEAALFFFAVMLAGLLCSRSLASIGMILFGANALRDVHPRRWLEQRWWLLGLGWVGLYALSWFWSADKGEWGAHVQVKLPFLLLPLAFSFLEEWTPRQLRRFTLIFSSLVTLGALYSLSFMLRDPHGYIEGYKFSHTLPTPAYNDHIAFSTLVAACIAWCCYSLPLWGRSGKSLISGIALLLFAYLHLLAAKSGLVAAYLFLFMLFLHLLVKDWKGGLMLFLAIGAAGLLAYYAVPTFRERVIYTRYSYERYEAGERTGLYSDMGRIISYNLALKIIRKHPTSGVGAGDMLDAMGEQYQAYYPEVTKEQYLVPHNQFLTVAVAAGIPALLLFMWWMAAPLALVRRSREGFYFAATWALLLVPLLVDPFLEVQSGVFVYLFFLLMQRSLLTPQTQRLRAIRSPVFETPEE